MLIDVSAIDIIHENRDFLSSSWKCESGTAKTNLLTPRDIKSFIM